MERLIGMKVLIEADSSAVERSGRPAGLCHHYQNGEHLEASIGSRRMVSACEIGGTALQMVCLHR